MIRLKTEKTIILLWFLIITFCEPTSAQIIEIDSTNAEVTAIHIEHTGGHGISINDVDRNGILINRSGISGVRVDSAGGNAISVGSSGHYGVYIQNSESSGLFVQNSGGSGLHVAQSSGDGMTVNEALDDGVDIKTCNDDGVIIGYARGNGIKVGNADEYSMDIQGDKRGIASVENHVARIFNFSAEDGGDVLALKINDADDPDGNSNFITFFKGGPDNSLSNVLGAIEGNGSGGITFKTSGADFAEALSQISSSEMISKGDVVGIKEGKITLNTNGVDRLMVITDRPAIIGNSKPSQDDRKTQEVSFLGQVPVRIIGPVRSGDWIVASGLNDGTAVVKSDMTLTLDDQIIGQAWESNLSPEEKKVNVVVGIDQTAALQSILTSLQSKMKNQEIMLNEHQSLIADMQIKLEKYVRIIHK